MKTPSIFAIANQPVHDELFKPQLGEMQTSAA
jgi:hypothetical protein